MSSHTIRSSFPCNPHLAGFVLGSLLMGTVAVYYPSAINPTNTAIGVLALLALAVILEPLNPHVEFDFNRENGHLLKRTHVGRFARVRHLAALSDVAAVTLSCCNWRLGENGGVGGIPHGYVTAVFVVTSEGRMIRVSDYECSCFNGYYVSDRIAKNLARYLEVPYRPGGGVSRAFAHRGSNPKEPQIIRRDLRHLPSPIFAFLIASALLCCLAAPEPRHLLALPACFYLFVPMARKIELEPEWRG